MINDEIVVPVNKQIKNFNGINLSYKVELTKLKDQVNIEVDINNGQKFISFKNAEEIEFKDVENKVEKSIELPINKKIVEYCLYKRDSRNNCVMFFHNDVCFKTDLLSFKSNNLFFRFYNTLKGIFKKPTTHYDKIEDCISDIFLLLFLNPSIEEINLKSLSDLYLTQKIEKIEFKEIECICCKKVEDFKVFKNDVFDSIINSIKDVGRRQKRTRLMQISENQMNSDVKEDMFSSFFDLSCKHVYQFYNEDKVQGVFLEGIYNILPVYIHFEGKIPFDDNKKISEGVDEFKDKVKKDKLNCLKLLF